MSDNREFYIGGVTLDLPDDVFTSYYSACKRDLYDYPLFSGCKSLLDVGTGTGVIPLLWHRLYSNNNKLKRIDAVDIDKKAVDCARKNFKKNDVCLNGSNIATEEKCCCHIYESDVFAKVPEDQKYDGIVFNGPHCYIKDSEVNDELRSKLGDSFRGIVDVDYKATIAFVNGLKQHLSAEGFAILTYSDCSIPTRFSKFHKDNNTTETEHNINIHGLIDLFSLLRDAGLSATFLSVHEFTDKLIVNNQKKRDSLEIDERCKWLWYNLLIRHTKTKDKSEGMSIEEQTNGFLCASESIAHIYSTVTPNKESYNELQERFEVLFSCMCTASSLTLSSNQHILTGFSIPGWADGHLDKENYVISYIYSKNLYDDCEKLKDYEHETHELINDMHNINSTLYDEYSLAIDIIGSSGVLSEIVAHIPADDSSDNSSSRIRTHLLPSLDIRHRRLETELIRKKGDPWNKIKKNDLDNSFKDIDKDIGDLTDHVSLLNDRSVSPPLKNEKLKQIKKQAKSVFRGFWVNCCRLNHYPGDNELTYCSFERTLLREGSLSAAFYVLSSESVQDEKIAWMVWSLRSFAQSANSAVVTFRINAERLKYARCAAAAAILARNVSHNLGSHVLNKCSPSDIRAKLCTVYSVENKSGKLYKPDWFSVYNMTEDMRRELDRYMLKKWDYIAEITSAPIYALTPASFFNQVVAPFLGNSLLIDNLASMESLGYEWMWRRKDKPVGPRCSLRVKAEFVVNSETPAKEYRPSFRIPDNNEAITYDKVFAPYGLRDIQFPDYPLVLAGRREGSPPDIDVLLPGPLGEFALYGIIENVIRNAAKHNGDKLLKRLKRFEKGKLQQALTVTIQVSDEDKHPDYYTLRVSEDLSDPDPLYKKLDDLLHKDLITNDGSQRKENWGLAEIMICANLLAGNSNYTSTPGAKDSVVKVLSYKMNQKDKEHLTYEMRLLKPKRLAVIGNDFLSERIDEEQKKDYEAAGIRFFDEIDETVAGFSFILANEFPDLSNEKISESQIPFRRLYFSADQKDPLKEKGWLYIKEKPEEFIKSEESPMELLCRIWQIWLSRWKLATQKSDQHHAQIELSVFLGNDELIAKKDWEKSASNMEEPYSVRIYTDSNEINVSNNNESEYLQRVLYDRHGMLLGKLPDFKLSERTSYVMFDKLSGDFSRIISPSVSFTFPYEVMEAGLLRVLIIDGRLAERAMNSVEDGDSNKVADTLVGNSKYFPVYWHIAKAARVMIATHISFDKKDSTPLHESSYKRRKEVYNKSVIGNDANAKRHSCPVLSLNCFEKDNWTLSTDPTGENGLKTSCEQVTNIIDMVVVHRGDIDKFPEEWGKSNKFIENIGKHVPWVVVESGRGMPVEVQKGSNRFMPFSVLEQWFGGGRVAKLCMANLLMNLTRR